MDDLKDNIFHKIINGLVPSFKVYEDADFLVILDRYPSKIGHCLILPKIPAKDIFDLDDKSAQGLYKLAKRIAYAIRAATGCDGINILQNNGSCAGQVIFYFHLHIIPRFNEDDIQIIKEAKNYETADFEILAEKIKFVLDGDKNE